MKSIVSATLGLAMVIGVSAADAAPLGLAVLGAPAAGEANLILVRGGCGFGRHRTWRGFCHLNHGWRWRRW